MSRDRVRQAIEFDFGRPERTGRDKTALMIRLPNQAGSLARTISPFEKFGVNMTWIESFPISRPEGGYMFFVELEGHELDARVRRAIAALERKVVRLEVLGSYARMTPVE